MRITVVCHKCGTLATAPDSAAGTQCKCSHCGSIVDVPGAATKRCCVCHIDVSNIEHKKDANGNYYCEKCAKAKQHAAITEPPAKASPGAAPGGLGESATCAICKAETPRASLSNFDGDLVCGSCARQGVLGTISYQLKRIRWGGTRVIYRCSQCESELESALDEAGKKDSCPQCGAAFEVPGRYEILNAATATETNSSVSAMDSNAISGSKTKWMVIGVVLGCAASVLAAVVVILLWATVGTISLQTRQPSAQTASATPAQPDVPHVVKPKTATTQPTATAAAPVVQRAPAETRPTQSARRWLLVQPASAIYHLYRNSVRGDELFKGKWVFMTGVVARVGPGLSNGPTVHFISRFSGIRCEFDDEYGPAQEEKLANLSRGQTVLIFGQGDGDSSGTVSFHHCEIVARADETVARIASLYASVGDYAKAMVWYRRAAEAGNLNAMVDIGNLYYYGHGVPASSTKAMVWFRKGAAAGSTLAMCAIGESYYYGLGVPKDQAKAVEWYRKAAAAGSAEAMVNIGDDYLFGEGVPTDYAKAKEWYRKAEKSGDPAEVRHALSRIKLLPSITTNP